MCLCLYFFEMMEIYYQVDWYVLTHDGASFTTYMFMPICFRSVLEI